MSSRQFKYFGLPMSVTWPVYRNVNAEQSSLGVFRLVGLVVKASASRPEDPGFDSRLRRDFFGVESYQ